MIQLIFLMYFNVFLILKNAALEVILNSFYNVCRIIKLE